MEYLVTFLEGVISFVSPCMLPMLPVYVTYFAGGGEGRRKTVLRAGGFILGFTAVFCILGVFAGSLGRWLSEYKTAVNAVCGAAVILFGLSYLGVFRLGFLRGMKRAYKAESAASAFVFGVVYAVCLTPCTGAFLGSALMMASSGGAGALKGAVLLLLYSLGLGIPFFAGILFIDSLSGAFAFIKKHYRVINAVCGAFLIAVGILMAFGIFDRFMRMFL